MAEETPEQKAAKEAAAKKEKEELLNKITADQLHVTLQSQKKPDNKDTNTNS